MKILPENLYHIYNRGNNKQPIFFIEQNYEYFLDKIKKNVVHFVDLLAYCLMPNHFHLLVHTNQEFDEMDFSDSFRHMLSSYTRAINKQEGFSGSLFQQNSKAKEINKPGYGIACFNYIHQNPLRSGLVKKIEDWTYSSVHEYLGIKSVGMCNKLVAMELLQLPRSAKEFIEMTYGEFDQGILKDLF